MKKKKSKKNKVVMATCDYCGESFPESEKDFQASMEDFCVCPNCVEYHSQQMISMGERKEKGDYDCDYYESDDYDCDDRDEWG